MKTSRLITTTILAIGIASVGFAGPGPEFWQRVGTAKKNAPKENVSKEQPTSASRDCGCSLAKK